MTKPSSDGPSRQPPTPSRPVRQPQFDFTAGDVASRELALTVTLNVPEGGFIFEWVLPGSSTPVARGFLGPDPVQPGRHSLLSWHLEKTGSTGTARDSCSSNVSSIRALLNRIPKQVPFDKESMRIGIFSDTAIGPISPNVWFPLENMKSWKWLHSSVLALARLIYMGFSKAPEAREKGRECLLAMVRMGMKNLEQAQAAVKEMPNPVPDLLDCQVTFDQVKCQAEFVWKGDHEKPPVVGVVQGYGPEQFCWKINVSGQEETTISTFRRSSVRTILEAWFDRFRTDPHTFKIIWIRLKPGSSQPVREQEPPFPKGFATLNFVEDNLVSMGEALRLQRSVLADELNPPMAADDLDYERFLRRLQRKEMHREEEERQRAERMAQLRDKRLRQQEAEEKRRLKWAERMAPARDAKPPGVISPVRVERAPLPPVPVHFENPALEFQETTLPLTDLRDYLLQEQAALWWVSNQSDDLLCLEYCRIERLEYQLRTARRVLGPLRGRALLSDEVGLGKTIEAGLVIKELLTRGMVKRFLILTVPSLVDQWAEELEEKFGLNAATTNQSGSKTDAEKFWTEPRGIVASLHTLKQSGHLEIASKMHWDILIVDEAHYLRNRESKAWQAVNSLSRQFLLLLTATPVQNSLEDLYNLVTLLQPGQLPSPKEFRSRFLDPKRPCHPREPEELRRLLGQVMIRNTRANAGIELPPRRAETVIFAADEEEKKFRDQWEGEFRLELSRLNPSQASLWGRLVLQAAGSSPRAWMAMLQKFPDQNAVRIWKETAPFNSSWKRKCELIPPLTCPEGGAVIFTQFLETQAALEDFLRSSGILTYAINGSTPAVQRQPMTEEFRKTGGALLLTHSGTEGRNLQFCHRLVNFDLPWNPMEIEQRIGRLHRLGQKHPVRIYNFVQAGSLQEHLLQILQEKLNLFELVVGETGMVLGERFASDEFADEILRRWRESEGRVGEAFAELGEELGAAKSQYDEVKQLDETLFAKDFESV